MIDSEEKSALFIKLLSDKFLGSQPGVDLLGDKFAIQVGHDPMDAFRVKDAMALSAGIKMDMVHYGPKSAMTNDRHIVSGSLDQVTPEAVQALITYQEPMRVQSAPAMNAGPNVMTTAKANLITRQNPGMSLGMSAG